MPFARVWTVNAQNILTELNTYLYSLFLYAFKYFVWESKDLAKMLTGDTVNKIIPIDIYMISQRSVYQNSNLTSIVPSNFKRDTKSAKPKINI